MQNNNQDKQIQHFYHKNTSVVYFLFSLLFPFIMIKYFNK